MKPLVTVLTDYGLEDHYVGHLKAVIKRICPESEVIDITHNIPKYNIALGAHVLNISRKYFPKGTVFLAVVDPGVGSARRNIIIKTRSYTYVGPDNGLLTLAASGELLKAYEIDVRRVYSGRVSPTFHGRDIYAPAAALIACGVSPEALGSPAPVESLTQPPLRLGWAEPTSQGLKVKVVHVDSFGNIVTSVTKELFEDVLKVRVGDEVLLTSDMSKWHRARYVETFSHVCAGDLAVYEGSYELIEIAKYMGSAVSEISGEEILLKNPT